MCYALHFRPLQSFFQIVFLLTLFEYGSERLNRHAFRWNPVRYLSPSSSPSNGSIQSIFLRTLFEYGSERLNRRAFQKESGATFVALGFFFQRFDSEHLSSHIIISTLLQSILFVLLVCLKRYMFLSSLVG